MNHPKDIGDRTTLAAMLALRDLGFGVSVPLGENTRYDLVIDDGQHLARVQCKTGRLRAGAVRFAVCSRYGHHLRPRESRRDYQGEVDYFAVSCPDTCGVSLVPIDHLQVKVQAALRVDPARNCQKQGVRLASDYVIAQVVVTTTALRASSGAPAPSA